jgi:hypothetical protein
MTCLSLSKPLTSLLFSTALSLEIYRSVAMYFSHLTNQSRTSLPHCFPQSIWSWFPSRPRCGWRRVSYHRPSFRHRHSFFIWIRLSLRELLNIQYSSKAWAKKINFVCEGNRRISLAAARSMLPDICTLYFFLLASLRGLQRDDFILVSVLFSTSIFWQENGIHLP